MLAVPAPASRLAQLRDGTAVLLRAQTPADRELLADLFAGLSGRSRFLRFMTGMPPALPRRTLDALSAVDGDRHVGVLALHGGRAIGAARYVRTGPGEAEAAFTVTDAFHRRGVARLMMDELIAHATAAGIERLTFEIHGENHAAAEFVRSLGATLRYSYGERVATLALGAVSRAA